MTPVDASILQYATGWDKAIVLRLLIGCAGTLVTLMTLRVFLTRGCSLLAGFLWLMFGLSMVAFSIAPQPIINSIMQTEYILRLRLTMGGLSIIVLLTTLESIRVTRLQERYALLWVATALILFAAAIFPQLVNLLRAVMGLQYMEAMAALAFTFLVLLAFHFSVSVSALQSKLEKIAQRNAILEARLEELEKQAKRQGAEGKAERSKPAAES